MSENLDLIREKKDICSVLSPRLFLIAEKPLLNDKEYIFDSEEGQNYIEICNQSRFKSVLTHCTYVKDNTEKSFLRDNFLKILKYYITNSNIDLNNILIAFVGNKALDALEKDFLSDLNDSIDSIDLNREKSVLRIFIHNYDNKTTFNVPFVVLPENSIYKNDIIQILNNQQNFFKEVKNPYATTSKLIKQFDLLLDLYNKKQLHYINFNGKLDFSKKKFQYFEISDKQTNEQLIYCGKDSICSNDTIELKKLCWQKLIEVLNTIPVVTENLNEYKELLESFNITIKIATQDEIEKEQVLDKDFRVYGSPNGEPSEWYTKWYNEAFKPLIEKQLREKDQQSKAKKNTIVLEGYCDKAKYEWIYDIEVFKEDWLFVAKTLDGKNKVICWNDADNLKLWIANKILIGFNNAAYDNTVIKHAMAYPDMLNDYQNGKKANVKRPLTVKEFSDQVIEERTDKDSSNIYNYNVPHFLSWDVSFHMPFDIRRNSLKKLTMSVLNKKNYDSSVPFNITRKLTAFEREEVEKYCEMDVDNTLELFLPDPDDLEKLKENPKHHMREFARDSYDIRWNMIVEYKMTAKTLINKSSSFAGKVLCGEDAKPDDMNTVKEVNGKKVFYSIPELAEKELAGTELLEFYHKNQQNPNYITEKFECYLGPKDDSHKYQFGFGGLHQALLNFGSVDLVNMDVASLYPSLLVEYNLMSRGAKANPESYVDVYHTRLQAKKDGKKLLNLGLKLILNGAIGAMLSEYNPLYDTWSNSTICVHGQLLIYILAKRLYDAGFNIVQTNTDGIMIEKQKDVDFMPIAEQWMKETRLVLEFDDIKILQQNNVNNYYCEFTNGKIKSKGFYLSNEKFGKATSKILCNLVTGQSPLEGTEPRDFVIYKKHSIGEIYDSITRKKVDGRSLAFVVGYDNDPRTQGYYSRSKNDTKVIKKDEKGKPILNSLGEPEYEITHTESKITGFTENMLLVDDLNDLKIEEINTREYINFAKNLLGKEEDFGPYYTEGYLKSDEPTYMQALNPFKDNTDPYPSKSGMINRNFLFECDYLTKEEQEEMINKVEQYTYRVTWSGHRSYHIVVRLNKPVTSVQYKRIWYYLKDYLGFIGADEQVSQPSRYTRVPDQINPKTDELQVLKSYNKYEFDTDSILSDLPRLKEAVPKKYKEYTGEITIEALQKHLKKLKWDEGERFISCQKLSPALISQVSLTKLLEMIPCSLDKNHIYVIKSKLRYWQKKKLEEESGIEEFEESL